MGRYGRVVTIVAAAWLAGCARYEAPLRIGINAWPGNEFLFLAQEKGFFAAEHVDVRLIEYSSLGDVRRAFDRGQLDGMTATLVELLQSREGTRRAPRAFMATDVSNGADVIVARGEIASGPPGSNSARCSFEPSTLMPRRPSANSSTLMRSRLAMSSWASAGRSAA